MFITLVIFIQVAVVIKFVLCCVFFLCNSEKEIENCGCSSSMGGQSSASP